MKNPIPNKPVVMIGYSGHSFVAIDILKLSGYDIMGYCDIVEKEFNPYSIPYLGSERDAETIKMIRSEAYFISVGENSVRGKIYHNMVPEMGLPVNAIHPSAIRATSVELGDGVMIAAGVVLNPFVRIGKGVICNTSCSIDHECRVGDFSHIAPGAILCGNVTVGKGSFIGAGAVIRQGITIGENVMIGAGCVVVRNVPDNMVMVGNPQKELIKK